MKQDSEKRQFDLNQVRYLNQSMQLFSVEEPTMITDDRLDRLATRFAKAKKEGASEQSCEALQHYITMAQIQRFWPVSRDAIARTARAKGVLRKIGGTLVVAEQDIPILVENAS
jgi:hypothetical protein